MEVILREDVAHLGGIGDIIKVKAGYARNYLLPRGLALIADRRNVRVLTHQQRVVANRKQRSLTSAQALAMELRTLRLVISARAGEEGKLFGSVTNIDLEKALADRGVSVERRRIRLEEPIKHVGEHHVPIHLAVGVDAELTVSVEAEES